MTLAEAIAHFSSQFTTVVPAVSKEQTMDLFCVCSGGITNDKDILPALYSSQELAIDAWLESAIFHAGYSRDKLEWIWKPELLEFQITIADRLQQQRLVANRFAVKSQFKAYK